MHRTFIISLLAVVMLFYGGAIKVQAFPWPWSKNHESRKSYELYPQSDKKSARKIKKARKKKASDLSKKQKARGIYKP